ncbi:MAG: phosphatase PAP2 family protein [Lachnospiraceae bacterium]|nr:phosphatase PAP2 family protein [Lachnospiraceae bacterium]MDE7201531.1 phosphatase PAP2 family protein [Lachnospiraceae bacterium]
MEGYIVKKKTINICRWVSGLIMQYKSLAVMSVYAVFYLAAFFYLERRDVAVHEINFGIDEYIPFCEIFIVPYLLWFAYVAFTVVFMCIRDREESDRLVAFLMAGMTIFIVVSAVFPNGHNLRPKVFERDNIFIDLIRHLYATDTPTNILPSIHVYNSVAIMIAVWRSRCFAGHNVIKTAMLALGLSIICSTVLIKQHSMLDVLLALFLSAVMYSICYKRTAVREKHVFTARIK